MKPFNKKIKKGLIITGCAIAGLFILVIVFISPLTKYLVEKYSVKYTGRQIKMDWAYVNPFTGYVHFSNFRIYEQKGDTIFLSMKGLSFGISLHKLLHKEYIITSITLDKPDGVAIMKSRNVFNFTDIINHFAGNGDTTHKKSGHVRFSILNWKIKDGIFWLRDTSTGLNYFIKDVQVSSPGKGWDADTMGIDMSFAAGIGTGNVKLHFSLNVNDLDYGYALHIHHLSLNIIEQYMRQFTNYGTFSAYADANLTARGNFMDVNNVNTRGRIRISDFHFGKSKSEDYLSFDTLRVGINKLNPEEHIYDFDSIVLDHPYFKYEKYDSLDNIQTIFGANGSNVSAVNANSTQFNLVIEFAHYLAKLSRNFFESAYKINRLAINRADFKFNDFSTGEEFTIATSPLYIKADSVYKTRDEIHLSLYSQILPYGSISIDARVHPKDSADFDLDYHLKKIPLSLFNPYLITYTSFPLDRGTLELNGAWKVRQGVIQSENHLLVIDPRVTKRVKNKIDGWIPMWLVMAFVRDRSNVIDYQIPITGNLDKPEFHLRQVVLDILRNVFVKPATTPYRFEVQAEEATIEKSLMLKWETHQSTMTNLQQQFVARLAQFIKADSSDAVIIAPENYSQKEKEYILFYEAKKKYYLAMHPEKAKTFDESDSAYVDKMSVKDPAFVHYLNKHVKHAHVYTIQEKCHSIIDSALVLRKYKALEEARRLAFLSYFKQEGIANKITFAEGHNLIPYDGFSYYKIEYRGAVPPYLVSAYREMDELNNEDPRKEYKQERKKIKEL